MQLRKGFSLHIVTSKTPYGLWLDMTPGVEEISTTRSSLNQQIPLPHGAIYRGLNGEGLGQIQISGTFGLRAYTVLGQQMTGTKLLQEIEKVVGQYWLDTASTNAAIAKKAVFEWHDWEEDRHFLVEPQSINYSRSRSNKIHRIYSWTLESYGKVQRKPRKEKIDPKGKAAQYLKTMQAVQENLAAAGRVLRKSKDAVKQTIDQFVTKPLDRIIRETERFVSGVTAFVDLPGQIFIDLGNKIDRAIVSLTERSVEPVVRLAMQLRQIKRVLNRFATMPEVLKPTFEQAAQEMRGALAAPVVPGESEKQRESKLYGVNSARLRGAYRKINASVSGARKVQVLAGDTLEKIAVRELGNVSRWLDIAILNGRIDNNDLLSLTELLIPADPAVGGSVQGQLATTNFKTQEDRLYGVDLATVVSANGKISVAFANNDLATVSGKKNVLQILQHMDRIAQGTLPEDPTWGIRAVVGSSQARQGAASVAWSLRETAQSDSRIKEAFVEVVVDGNTTRYERSVVLLGNTDRLSAGSIVGGV